MLVVLYAYGEIKFLKWNSTEHNVSKVHITILMMWNDYKFWYDKRTDILRSRNLEAAWKRKTDAWSREEESELCRQKIGCNYYSFLQWSRNEFIIRNYNFVFHPNVRTRVFLSPFDNLYSPPSGSKKDKNNNNLTKLNYYNIHSTISPRNQQNEVLQNTLSHRR